MSGLLPIIGGIIVAEDFSQTCLKSYYLGNGLKYLILGFIGYMLVAILLTISYRYAGMGIVNLLWSGLSIITVMILGALVYNEKFHVHDAVAFALIMSGIGIIQYYGDS